MIGPYYFNNGKLLYLKAHYKPNAAFYVSFALTILTIIPCLLISPFFLTLTFGLAIFTALIFSYCKVYYIHENKLVEKLPTNKEYKILKTFELEEESKTYYYIDIKRERL